MPLTIHELGYIVGGSCDRRHQERATREATVAGIIPWLLTQRFLVKVTAKSYKVGRLPKSFGWRKVAEQAGGSAHREIAYWRVLNDLMPVLKKQGELFTLARFRSLAIDVQKFEFELGGSLDPIRITGRLTPPHCDGIYKRRMQAGHFNTHAASGRASSAARGKLRREALALVERSKKRKKARG